MADDGEPRFTTLAERIAALNQQKNFQAPPPTAGKRPPPPPPPAKLVPKPGPAPVGKSPTMPPRPARAATDKVPPPLPRRTTTHDTNGDQPSSLAPAPGRAVPPPVPSRATPPALPTRRPSAQNLSVRRNSNASDISQLSGISSLSLSRTKSGTPNTVPDTPVPRKLPPTLDQADLPPLPPTRRELEAARAKEAPESAPPLPTRRIADPPQPSLPPRLPSRPASNSPVVAPNGVPSPALPARRLPPPASSSRAKSALDCGFGSSTRKPSPPPVPPPIPLSSRPTIAEIDAAANRVASAPPKLPNQTQSCLPCRDFSAADTLASQHPTSSLPRHDPISHLAHVLCAPLASPTDKARAVFTWCHHNIVYDVHGLFNNCIPRGQTPAETIFSGKAVCEGFARVYESIASRAGLACVVVGGHGKGLGFAPTKKGEPTPKMDPTGHAWNAVRIDGGEWKLIDACWGAGALGEGNKYNQRFAPEFFTMSNERFGATHFPGDPRHWYRKDGRHVGWEEYILGPARDEPADWMGDASKEGLDETNFAPLQKHVPVGRGTEMVRFQVAKVCEHWTAERNGAGKDMLFVLSVGGVDGQNQDLLPVETDGFWYWVDVEARQLGRAGEHVVLMGCMTMDGRSARGLTREEWKAKKPKGGLGYTFLVRWELV
ncbi:hypothetical protein C8A05DRAFT_35187 [Staphylotrichum tortipilum]|uniref:Transglutaminase-like domain-containing protein n=1 Tax=Staphylotrichum tortipilum TaxID=2831512 RepID=A0AAN6RSH0_9PEZI|nr:hypothetical protein C8A05DRAFT_35187 [Staphylotrichum longicolle]